MTYKDFVSKSVATF